MANILGLDRSLLYRDPNQPSQPTPPEPVDPPPSIPILSGIGNALSGVYNWDQSSGPQAVANTLNQPAQKLSNLFSSQPSLNNAVSGALDKVTNPSDTPILKGFASTSPKALLNTTQLIGGMEVPSAFGDDALPALQKVINEHPDLTDAEKVSALSGAPKILAGQPATLRSRCCRLEGKGGSGR